MIIIFNKADLCDESVVVKRPQNFTEKDFKCPTKTWEKAEVILYQESYGDVHILKTRQGVSHV